MTGSLGTLGHARARNGGLCEARCDLGSVADDWTGDLESKAPSMCPTAQKDAVLERPRTTNTLELWWPHPNLR
jgi:hypothetical protein